MTSSANEAGPPEVLLLRRGTILRCRASHRFTEVFANPDAPLERFTHELESLRARSESDRSHERVNALIGVPRIAYQLKRAWSDDTTEVVYEPRELIAKLVPLMPPRTDDA